MDISKKYDFLDISLRDGGGPMNSVEHSHLVKALRTGEVEITDWDLEHVP